MYDRTFGCTRLCMVEYSRADNTGRTDISAALQSALYALPDKGGTLHFPPGVYLIDPTKPQFWRDNVNVDIDPQATILVLPNAAPRYGVFQLRGCKNIQFGGGGKIVGDRDTHKYVTQGLPLLQQTHEWGHAFQVFGSSNITIRDLSIDGMTGDGVSLSALNVDGARGDEPCEDVALYNVNVTRSRRQGVSVGKASGVQIVRCELSYTNGTDPQCGIDIEPESGGIARDILIDQCHIHHNARNGVNILHRSNVDSPVERIRLTGNNIEYNVNGVHATYVNGLQLSENTIVHNSATGFRIDAGCTNVAYNGNLFGQNYRHAARPKPIIMSGWTKALESDVLIRNTAANNAGVNTYS